VDRGEHARPRNSHELLPWRNRVADHRRRRGESSQSSTSSDPTARHCPIYGRAQVGAGVAEASTNTTDYDTESTNIGAEVGVRFQAAKFLLTGGYMLHPTEYDPEGITFVEETSWKFEGFFLSVGLRW
jgi:hypothetical protein